MLNRNPLTRISEVSWFWFGSRGMQKNHGVAQADAWNTLKYKVSQSSMCLMVCWFVIFFGNVLYYMEFSSTVRNNSQFIQFDCARYFSNIYIHIIYRGRKRVYFCDCLVAPPDLSCHPFPHSQSLHGKVRETEICAPWQLGNISVDKSSIILEFLA